MVIVSGCNARLRWACMGTHQKSVCMTLDTVLHKAYTTATGQEGLKRHTICSFLTLLKDH